MKHALALLAVLAVLATAGQAQEKYEKVGIFVSGSGFAAPVAESLKRLIDASKPFQSVGQKDPSKVVVLVSCMDRKESEPFICMYIAQYNGGSFKMLLGAANGVSQNAEELATRFLGAIAGDVSERYNDTDKDYLRAGLESCLVLTDTKCNVPDPLQKEFDAKQLTLGQYLLKKR